MSNIVQDIKDKVKPNKGGNEEQRFTTLPHPAKTNNPNDLHRDPPQPGAGLNSKPEIAAHHAHGPQILDNEVANSFGPAPSREELDKRTEELNRG